MSKIMWLRFTISARLDFTCAVRLPVNISAALDIMLPVRLFAVNKWTSL